MLAIAGSLAFGLEDRGVDVVGAFPSGLPRFAVPEVGLARHSHSAPRGDRHRAPGLHPGHPAGARLRREERLRSQPQPGTRPRWAWRTWFTGLFQGFSVTGSQARTTINDSAGGKTQLASLVAAGTLILFLRLPDAVDRAAARGGAGGAAHLRRVHAGRVRRHGAHLPLLPAQRPVGGADHLGRAGGRRRARHPGRRGPLAAGADRPRSPTRPTPSCASSPGGGFHDLGDTTNGQTMPGFIAYRFYAPLLFSNASHFVERVRELVAASPTPVRWFLVDAQAITDIDITAAEALRGLNKELQQQGIAMKFAHANRPLRSCSSSATRPSSSRARSWVTSQTTATSRVASGSAAHCEHLAHVSPGRGARGRARGWPAQRRKRTKAGSRESRLARHRRRKSRRRGRCSGGRLPSRQGARREPARQAGGGARGPCRRRAPQGRLAVGPLLQVVGVDLGGGGRCCNRCRARRSAHRKSRAPELRAATSAGDRASEPRGDDGAAGWERGDQTFALAGVDWHAVSGRDLLRPGREHCRVYSLGLKSGRISASPTITSSQATWSP